jgi:CSLREA domain-containing protein
MRSRQLQSRRLKSRQLDKHSNRRRLGCERLEDRRLLATIQVTSLDDTVSLNDGKTTLREAIFAASTLVEDAEIVFDPALFAAGAQSITLKHGTLTISDSVTITGPGAELLTIDASGSDPTPNVKQGDGVSALTLIDFAAIGPHDIVLRDLSITGGDSEQGGGIFSRVNLTLEGCIVHDNFATSHGGGIESTGGSLTIRDSELRGNRSGALGGGFHSFSSEVEITGSRFESNEAGRAGGGASGASGSLIVTGSVFRDNYSARGGGLDWHDMTMAIRGSTFIENRAAIQGGGVSLVVSESLSTGRLDIIDSSFVGNRTEVPGAHGGGLFVTASDAGAVVLTQLTVSRNTAAGDGGGMAIVAAGTPEVRSSTFTGNSAAGSGGGIHSRNGVLELNHTIVAGNEAGAAIGADLRVEAPGSVTAAYAIVGTNSGSTLAEAPLGSPDANGNLIGGPVHGTIDPLLGPLADNGGPALPGGFRMLTHAPLPGSPAIDAGDSSLAAGVGETPAFDQRGAPFSRVFGARIDIGAVEANGAPIVVDTLVDESDGDYRKGDVSLREAIELANARPGAETIVFASAALSGNRTISLSMGELLATDSLTIAGPATGNVITIDGLNQSRVINFDSFGDLALSRLTLTRGRVSTENPENDGLATVGNGGALRSTSAGFVTLDNVSVLNSVTTGMRGDGGGVFVLGSIIATNSRFSGNRAEGRDAKGGSIAAWGLATLTRAEVRQSRASLGGGISAFELTIDQSVVMGNMVVSATANPARGGGIYVPGGSLSIATSSITNNSALSQSTNAFGGGIHVDVATSVSISRSTIANNVTSGEGGGLSAGFAANHVLITGSTFSGNQARSGGAMVTPNLRLLHSTVVLNRSTGLGEPGGIRGDHTVLDHSIVARNLDPQTVELNLRGVVQASASLIGNLTGFTLEPFEGGYSNLIGGPSGASLDPRLGPLGGNGGPALPGGTLLATHAPLTGSPVIDAGDPAVVSGVDGVPEFDQRGAPFTRVAGTRVDIGAVESQAAGGALSGDFTLDGRVDGTDFLVWQRGLGRASGATIRQGDATADGDVDANDLAVWRARVTTSFRGQAAVVAGNEDSSEGGAVSIQLSAASRWEEAEAISTSKATDAVFAAGDFAGLFAVNELPSAARGKWRPARRGL